MKTSVKLLLAFATAAAAIAPAAAQQVVAWDEAYRQADARIAQLTLDEKISFMRGYSSFFFYGVPEKGMPYIYLSDATQGVHMRDNLSDPTMVRQLERSTAFPCPISLAATFNPSLAYRAAEAVGEECRAGGIEVLLGPGMNIYRNSQNGRNFEYMGEDPLLASAMVAEYVKGMQSTGTVACLKHFICNETEFYRRRSNSIVDERALHELYLPPFKAGIDAGVGYVMTSYNRLNGEWAGQNADLIRRILRGELGFRGCVMSDWSSVNDTEKVVKSGQNVEMPGRKEFFGEVRALLKEGRITEKDIEKMIRPNIATSIAFGLYDREKYVPALLEKFPAHKQTGYDVAAEGIVLLRNNGILPLAEGRKILLTGRFTEQIPRTGGSTSSSAEVLGYDNVTLTAALREVYGDAVRVVEKPSREELAAADVVLLSTGTIDVESFERPFALPKEEEAFIRTAVESNPNTIVLVNSGSGIRMGGWNDKAAAVIYGWYPGQSGFTALAVALGQTAHDHREGVQRLPRQRHDARRRGVLQQGAPRLQRTPDPALRHRLQGVGAGRLPLVRDQGHRTALPLRIRTFVHHVRAFETPRPEGVPRRQAAESERHADQHGRSRGRGGRAALRHGERPDGPPAEKGAERLPESDPGPRQKRRRGVRTRPAGAGVLGHAVARLEGQPGRIHPFAGNLVGRHRRHAARLGEITPQRQERTASAESSLLTIVNEVSVSRPSPRLLFLPFIAHHAELQHAVSRLLAHSRTESDRSIRQYAAFGRIHLRFRHKSPKNLPVPYEPLILYMDSVCRNA